MGSPVPNGKRFQFYGSVDKTMTILKDRLRELNMKKVDVESRLKREICPGKKRKKGVAQWFDNVWKINEETQYIEEQVRETGCLSRARLGKRIENMIRLVKEVDELGSFNDGLFVDVPLISGKRLPTTTLISNNISVKNYRDEIWEYLMYDDEVRKIGVCGMKGVGKTIIMEHINNQLLEECTDEFDNVIWVTVSRELDVIKLQDDIAHALDEDLSKYEDKKTRADMLLEMLKRKKRFVLILDNVGKPFSYEEVGIPEPTITNGCKIVLISQSRNECQTMDCKIIIKVGILTKEEACNLFLDEVGRDHVLSHPNLEVIVKLVAEQCAGLPLAIIKVAKDMKGKYDIHEWRNALKELRGRIKGAKGVESKVFERLKFNYDHLKDFRAQHCFLYCKLYPENFEIPKRELIEYWIAEGLVDEMTSREAEYKKGHYLLDELESNQMLKSSSTNHRSVKMSDWAKNMAADMTKANPQFMMKAREQLKELPNEKEWTEDLEKVSLMENFISEIPSNLSPKCQRLSTLLLQRNPLKEVSSSFFENMSGLRVLDLSYTDISILPNNISHLKNLTALLLKECWALEDVPSLAKLEALRTLDLRYTAIKKVPEGMEMLVNLRYLNLCARNLKMLPTEILPNFHRLQCLIVWWGSNTLKVKGDEVASLKTLETFVGQMHDVQDFNMYAKSLQHRRPCKFHLQLGPSNPFYVNKKVDFEEDGKRFSKHVGLKNCKISGQEGEKALVLPNDVEFLSIEDCNDVSSLCDVSSLKTDLLKYCEITNCNGIECVLWTSKDSFTQLQNLEVLLLKGLEKLHVLLKLTPTAPIGTFSCLKELSIYNCPNIKKLFTLGMLPQLQNLEEIHVYECKGIEEIIAEKTEEEQGKGIASKDDSTTITLPKLRLLFLCYLPELKSMVYGKKVMVCDSLQQISVDNCPKLKRLPLSLPMVNGELSPPRALQSICVQDKNWWESLEWDQTMAKKVLGPFVK